MEIKPGGLNGSLQHSRKACLQEFQNATFFEDIELAARPFKTGQKSAPLRCRGLARFVQSYKTTCL